MACAAWSASRRRISWSSPGNSDGRKQNAAIYTKDDGSPKYEAAFSDFFYDDMVSGVLKMMSTGAVLSSPAIAGDTILFGSADGTLYAIQ